MLTTSKELCGLEAPPYELDNLLREPITALRSLGS